MFSVCLLDLLVGLHIATLKTVRGRQPSSGCNLRGPRPGIINSKISLVEGGSLYHQLCCQLQKLLKIVNQSNKKLIFYTDNLKVNILENSYKILFKVSTHWFNIYCCLRSRPGSPNVVRLFVVMLKTKEWYDDRMTKWLNDQIKKWQNDKMTV